MYVMYANHLNLRTGSITCFETLPLLTNVRNTEIRSAISPVFAISVKVLTLKHYIYIKYVSQITYLSSFLQ